MSALEQPLPNEITNGGTPESLPPESEAGAASPPTPAPAAKEDRRDTLLRIANTASKVRDERGKFAPATPAPAAAPAPVEEITAPERPAMPRSFKKELESHWGALPHEFAAAVVQRETDYEKGVQPLKERARVADEFLNAVKPFEQMIRGENSTPIAAVQSLLHTAQTLRDPAQRVPAIASLMQQYQVSIEDLQQALAGNGSPQPNLNPQYVSQLVKQELTSYQQQQSEQQSETEIQKFAADPANKHFDAVADWMGPILASEKFRTEHHGKPAQDKLKAAYTLATRMDPAIWQQMEAEQLAAARAAQQVTQAKNASVQVRGAPASGPATKINPKDRHALISTLVSGRR
jgi:hypothetical protein